MSPTDPELALLAEAHWSDPVTGGWISLLPLSIAINFRLYLSVYSNRAQRGGGHNRHLWIVIG